MTAPHSNAPVNPAWVALIPTLTQNMVMHEVPEAVRLALNARATEKKALLAMSDELVNQLRPEIERLTADLVQRALAGVWEKRARNPGDGPL
ncbi:hypothetical protein [Limnohabitans sp.]|jgi:hypothetical protein|uniref:hypothetical protein n=1 Tax=Limnohabitans sp. TaxID=1907725 RepID=UPI0037BE65ED